MSTDIVPVRAQRKALWLTTLLLGVCLCPRAADLRSAWIPIAAAGAPRPEESSCTIPAAGFGGAIAVLSRDIARRFHLAEGAAMSITRAAVKAAQARGLDPTLVLAIAAVESKFKPGAVNPATGARGLMQIMPKWHQAKILDVGGESSLMLIAPNIDVGAAILSEYLDAGGGDIEDALSRYLGTAGGERYVKRVHAEMAHLTRVMKNG